MSDLQFITDKDVKQAEQDLGVPKFGPLGWITDYRTYRRWLPEQGRRETFYERNQRVVNYNLSLALGLQSTDSLEEEGKLMFAMMNNFLADTSGRTKWVGGTLTSESHPAANFNCSALAINRLSAFTTLFELLMLGTGVGYRVFTEDVTQLPEIKQIPSIAFDEYRPCAKEDRHEVTKSVSLGLAPTLVSTTIQVGDSRDGWIDALRILLDHTFRVTQNTTLHFNFDSIRPRGERINGFGGTASGPEALKGIIEDVCRILQECPGDKLRSIDCMDISDAIAKGVVAGSSRRSALICLFEEGDEACASAKADMPDYKTYRWQSNNTECVGSPHQQELRTFLETNPDASPEEITNFISQFKPTKAWFENRFKIIAATGEPGINNFLAMIAKRWVAAREWRSEVPLMEIWDRYCNIATNPCHEIVLSAGINRENDGVSFCNLTTLPLQNFVKFSGTHLAYLDLELLEQAVRLITRIGLRQTCVEMPRPELHETQIEERLLGVSATGWRQMMDMLGVGTADPSIVKIQQSMRYWANDEATKYSAELGVKRPLLVTCIKPEGTASKVFGSSDGLHWEWAPYYIRRIQMSTTDALAKALKDQGFPWHPTPYDIDLLLGDKGDNTWERIDYFDTLTKREKLVLFEKSNAIAFAFPIKAAALVAQGNVSAVEQLENVKSFAVNYTDHLPSSTVTVKADEWGGVAQWVFDNWDTYVTAAFLSYWSGNYPLLPYEDITPEKYYELLNQFNPKYIDRDSFVVDEELVNFYEKQALVNDEDIDAIDLGADCSSSGCPIR